MKPLYAVLFGSAILCFPVHALSQSSGADAKLDAILRMLQQRDSDGGTEEVQPNAPKSSVTGQQIEQIEATLENHELRLQALDAKLGALLDLLQGSPTSAPAVEPSSDDVATPVPPAAQANYQPGLILEAYLLEFGPPESLAKPSGFALGALIDRGPLFQFSAFMRDETLKRYSGRTVGLRWSGYLKVPESSPYLIELELASKQNDARHIAQRGQSHSPASCFAQLSMEDKKIASMPLGGPESLEGFNYYHNVHDGSFVRVASRPIEQGYLKTELWLACTPMDPKAIAVSLRMKGRSDRVMRLITAKDLFHLR